MSDPGFEESLSNFGNVACGQHVSQAPTFSTPPELHYKLNSKRTTDSQVVNIIFLPHNVVCDIY